MKKNPPAFSHPLLKGATISERKKAFTLVELIIVITILAILATIAFVSFSNYAKESRDAQRLSSLTNIEKWIDVYGIEVWRFPIPENSTSFTGWTNSEIKQGILTKNVLPNLWSTPVDPVSGKNYTYSVFWNGKYYQIATGLENELSHSLGARAYANTFKTTKLVGNYRYDPSLPSLIIWSGTNIFSPDTCFITNGWTDTLENCITKKSDFAWKNTDTSLVGYWDMETLSWALLKDLSGNGNNLHCQDRNNVTSNTVNCNSRLVYSWAVWMWTNFNFDGINWQILRTDNNIIFDWTWMINYDNWYTITYVSKEKPSVNTQTFFYHYNFWKNRIPSTWYVNIRSFSFSWELLIDNASSCRPVHPLCINNMNFLQKNWYNSLSSNIHTIALHDSYDYYLNWKKIFSFPIQKTSNIKNSSIFYLWGTSNNTSWFHGIIDEVKIYNRALSDEEILQQARIAWF